ncbi:MAG: succinate dehydrogenase, hydrophobic membrane anchor protein [Dehalococcoidales bacterium]|nr:succinate dehydrogenase, hydrophobic membrane anchor protein [Dehalococcoidales bacterium]
MQGTVPSRRSKAGNYYLWSWLFLRVSGVLIIFLVLTHLAIMHVFTPIQNIDFDFVAGRWSIPAWRWFDLGLLFLAFIHGLVGFRVVMDDYVHSRAWRLTVRVLLVTAGFVFLVVGTEAILSFQAG